MTTNYSAGMEDIFSSRKNNLITFLNSQKNATLQAIEPFFKNELKKIEEIMSDPNVSTAQIKQAELIVVNMFAIGHSLIGKAEYVVPPSIAAATSMEKKLYTGIPIEDENQLTEKAFAPCNLETVEENLKRKTPIESPNLVKFIDVKEDNAVVRQHMLNQITTVREISTDIHYAVLFHGLELIGFLDIMYQRTKERKLLYLKKNVELLLYNYNLYDPYSLLLYELSAIKAMRKILAILGEIKNIADTVKETKTLNAERGEKVDDPVPEKTGKLNAISEARVSKALGDVKRQLAKINFAAQSNIYNDPFQAVHKEKAAEKSNGKVKAAKINAFGDRLKEALAEKNAKTLWGKRRDEMEKTLKQVGVTDEMIDRLEENQFYKRMFPQTHYDDALEELQDQLEAKEEAEKAKAKLLEQTIQDYQQKSQLLEQQQALMQQEQDEKLEELRIKMEDLNTAITKNEELKSQIEAQLVQIEEKTRELQLRDLQTEVIVPEFPTLEELNLFADTSKTSEILGKFAINFNALIDRQIELIQAAIEFAEKLKYNLIINDFGPASHQSRNYSYLTKIEKDLQPLLKNQVTHTTLLKPKFFIEFTVRVNNYPGELVRGNVIGGESVEPNTDVELLFNTNENTRTIQEETQTMLDEVNESSQQRFENSLMNETGQEDSLNTSNENYLSTRSETDIQNKTHEAASVDFQLKLKELVKYFTKASTTVDAQTGDLIDLVEDGKVNTNYNTEFEAEGDALQDRTSHSENSTDTDTTLSSGVDNQITTNITSAFNTFSKAMVNAMESVVRESNSKRERTVTNTTTTEKETQQRTGTVRKIRNDFSDAMMNFEFREMLQCYTTVFSITDIRFGISNGIQRRILPIDSFFRVLNEYVNENATALRNRLLQIVRSACRIVDFTQENEFNMLVEKYTDSVAMIADVKAENPQATVETKPNKVPVRLGIPQYTYEKWKKKLMGNVRDKKQAEMDIDLDADDMLPTELQHVVEGIPIRIAHFSLKSKAIFKLLTIGDVQYDAYRYADKMLDIMTKRLNLDKEQVRIDMIAAVKEKVQHAQEIDDPLVKAMITTQNLDKSRAEMGMYQLMSTTIDTPRPRDKPKPEFMEFD